MIRDAEHLARLQAQLDLVLADGNAQTLFGMLEALIGRNNPADKPNWSWADWWQYAAFAKRNGYTTTDVIMALRAGKYPRRWMPTEDMGAGGWIEVWSRREHASF